MPWRKRQDGCGAARAAECHHWDFKRRIETIKESLKRSRVNYRPLEHRLNKTKIRLRRSVTQRCDCSYEDGLKEYKPQKASAASSLTTRPIPLADFREHVSPGNGVRDLKGRSEFNKGPSGKRNFDIKIDEL